MSRIGSGGDFDKFVVPEHQIRRKGGHGSLAFMVVVNKDARCLNTLSIFDGSEDRNFQIRRC